MRAERKTRCLKRFFCVILVIFTAAFLFGCANDNGEGDVSTETTGAVQTTEIYIEKGDSILAIKSVDETALAEGITYGEYLYRDADGLPVRAYVLKVKKGAGTILTSLPDDSLVFGAGANMKKQVESAVSNGKNVIAGINGDFFTSEYIPTGLCIKDGVELHRAGSRPWFGVTADGEAVIGTAEEYEGYKGALVSAVGGSDILLKNGDIYGTLTGNEFADTKHPRTAVGITPEGEAVLLVVDGRQPFSSNGATLSDLANILSSLGCSEGINLDGGGSSTFVLRENGRVTVKNSPSGFFMRDVANGLVVTVP